MPTTRICIPVAPSILNELQHADPELLNLAASMDAKAIRVVFKARLRAVFPSSVVGGQLTATYAPDTVMVADIIRFSLTAVRTSI